MPLSADCVEKLEADASHDPGCITKCVGSDWSGSHGSYRKNGYDYICANHSRIYDLDFTKAPWKQRIQVKTLPKERINDGTVHWAPREDPRQKKDCWHLKTGINFRKNYAPFLHDYHHILPWEVIKRSFRREEGLLLQQAKYNLNAGHNLIILPKSQAYGTYLKLYHHMGNHPGYNDRLAEVVADAKKALNPKPWHTVNKQNIGQLKRMFDDWSIAEFDEIITAARGNPGVAQRIDDHQLNSMT